MIPDLASGFNGTETINWFGGMAVFLWHNVQVTFKALMNHQMPPPGDSFVAIVTLVAVVPWLWRARGLVGLKK